MRSGIADYCLEQLVPFQEHFDLGVVIDDKAPAPVPLPCPVERYAAWRKRPPTSALRLYQLGNSTQHTFALVEALRVPGVVVLHDFTLHHHLYEWLWRGGRRDAYRAFMLYERDGAGQELVEKRLRNDFPPLAEFDIPLNTLVLDSCTGVIVHSWESYHRIRALRPSLPVRRVPLHCPPLPAGYREESREAVRARLGLPQEEQILCAFGLITSTKQLGLVLRALAAIRRQMPPFRFIAVGEETPANPIGPLAAELGLQDCFHATGNVELATFYDYIQACDFVVNLRYPSGGESSAVLARVFGMGRTAVVFDHGSFTDYPDDVALKIPLALDDTEKLQEALLRLAHDPERCQRMGQEARSYSQRELDIRKTVPAYADFLLQCAETAHLPPAFQKAPP